VLTSAAREAEAAGEAENEDEGNALSSAKARDHARSLPRATVTGCLELVILRA
jgi:hypothetical protein